MEGKEREAFREPVGLGEGSRSMDGEYGEEEMTWIVGIGREEGEEDDEDDDGDRDG